MMVPLGKLGNFTATVQKVTNDKALFIFDDYVTKRPMNKDGGNAGGYSQSDLKKMDRYRAVQYVPCGS